MAMKCYQFGPNLPSRLCFLPHPHVRAYTLPPAVGDKYSQYLTSCLRVPSHLNYSPLPEEWLFEIQLKSLQFWSHPYLLQAE